MKYKIVKEIIINEIHFVDAENAVDASGKVSDETYISKHIVSEKNKIVKSMSKIDDKLEGLE